MSCKSAAHTASQTIPGKRLENIGKHSISWNSTRELLGHPPTTRQRFVKNISKYWKTSISCVLQCLANPGSIERTIGSVLLPQGSHSGPYENHWGNSTFPFLHTPSAAIVCRHTKMELRPATVHQKPAKIGQHIFPISP